MKVVIGKESYAGCDFSWLARRLPGLAKDLHEGEDGKTRLNEQRANDRDIFHGFYLSTFCSRNYEQRNISLIHQKVNSISWFKKIRYTKNNK